MQVFFENVKTRKRYKVLALNKEKKTITLKGDYNEFIEEYDKARFEKLGYVLVKVEEEAEAA